MNVQNLNFLIKMAKNKNTMHRLDFIARIISK